MVGVRVGGGVCVLAFFSILLTLLPRRPLSLPFLQQFHLLEFLKQRFEQKHRVSVERVVSGPGIANVYDFLADHYPDKVDKEIDAGALCVVRCALRLAFAWGEQTEGEGSGRVHNKHTHTHTCVLSLIPSYTTAFRAAGELGGKIVAENAKPGTLCGMALDIFAGAYGAEAGVAGKWVGVGLWVYRWG